MQIEYRNKRLEKICTLASMAQKKYGADMAEKIQQRIGEIFSADSVKEMIEYRIGRCHPLKGDRKGQYAVDLIQPHRMAFSIKGNTIEIACIEEIIDDYH
ncbi:plasmid maintenance system killer protein [Eubacterium minutum ATCC 700079]|nr:plasmid maintenance system killer protein [Eubacterium minutum ATCC 700079]